MNRIRIVVFGIPFFGNPFILYDAKIPKKLHILKKIIELIKTFYFLRFDAIFEMNYQLDEGA